MSRDIIAAFTTSMLQNNIALRAILYHAQAQPDEFLLQTYAASLYLYDQQDESNQKAHVCLVRVAPQLQHKSTYEQLMHRAISAWCLQDYHQALTLFREALALNPHDLLALKYSEWIFYVIGQAYHAELFCAFCEDIKQHHLTNAYFLSIYAFALELSGQRTEALRVAEASLQLMPSLAWAQHAVAHVHVMQGNILAGIQALESHTNDWNTLVPTLHGHMHWHLALLYLADDDASRALDVFEQQIWAGDDEKKTVLVQQDAISFLCRLDLKGISTDAYWPDIMRYIKPVCLDTYMPFNSLHYLYACGKTQHAALADALLARATEHAHQQCGASKRAWQTVGLPALQGMYAFSCGQHQRMLDYFKPILPQLGCVGGSDAEDALFYMMYDDASLKCSGK